MNTQGRCGTLSHDPGDQREPGNAVQPLQP